MIPALCMLPGLALAAEPAEPAERQASEAQASEGAEGRASEGRVSETEALRREVEELRAELRDLRRTATTEAGHVDLGDERSRTGIGRPVLVAEGEEVTEAVAVGDDVRVAGRVLGDAVSFGGDVLVAPTGEVVGNAVSFGGRVRVDDGGAVAGDRVAVGIPGVSGLPVPGLAPPPDPADVAPAVAAADVRTVAHDAFGASALRDVRHKIVWMLSFAGAGVLVVGLFPARVTRVARDLEDRPLRAAVVGTLASSFLALFAVLFSILTLGLGLPVGALLLAILGIAWILGFVAFCQAVGDRLPVEPRPGSAWPSGRWIAFLVGVLMLTFAGSLPWVGWMVLGVVSVLGIGATFATRFGAS